MKKKTVRSDAFLYSIRLYAPAWTPCIEFHRDRIAGIMRAKGKLTWNAANGVDWNGMALAQVGGASREADGETMKVRRRLSQLLTATYVQWAV